MKKFISIFLILLVIFAPLSIAELRHDEVLQLNDRFEPKALEFARQMGAEIVPVKDGRSFVLWWAPEGFDPTHDTVFVSIHGHQGWATKDFQVWYPRIKDRKYAFLGIQWWYGRSAEWIGYAKPDDIYGWIKEALQARSIPPGHVIFTGFSMGGANSYAVTYLDRLQNPPYFNVTISNSGSMEADFPPNRPFLEGAEGSKPFSGVHWFLYCSEHDEQRPQSCTQMDWTKTELERLGATVEKYIRDPVGGHGGFMKPENHEPVLDAADQIIIDASTASG